MLNDVINVVIVYDVKGSNKISYIGKPELAYFMFNFNSVPICFLKSPWLSTVLVDIINQKVNSNE